MAQKILVVDDERVTARLVQTHLERQGYAVTLAYDGQEGLDKIASEQPDLIVLDVMMPDMDGFEVLKRLKQNPDTRAIPVIMLTGKTEEADEFRGWASGVDCYLTKPVKPAELIEYVQRIFKARAPEDEGESEEGAGGAPAS